MPVRSVFQLAAITVALASPLAGPASALAQRQYGIDVSQWQGNINWATVAKPTSQGGGGMSFAFIRSTRGGTTGSGDSVETTVGNGRYDDPRFTSNITGAKAAGLLVAPYHFARADIPTSNPVDEATHFLQVAGAYMTGGYLRPVLDLEAGSQLTRTALTDWALAFCAEIVRVKGTSARPIIYVNSSYANDEVDARLAAFDLWLARPSTSPNTLTGDPVGTDTYPNPYGRWLTDSVNDPNPWAFWQYYIPPTSTPANVPGVQFAVDLDVVQSERRPLTSFLIPEPSALALLFVPVSLLARRRRFRSA